MNSPQNPSHSSGKDASDTVQSLRDEDWESANSGHGEKRHPDGGTPLESISLFDDAADWTRRTPAGTPEKPGTENPATYK
ncbi:MAG: hypothetical protein JWM59_1875 [Verrucomicrobiales bacterium]|nr:hypothetical protein [Verrucomicrobiales bacterium]